MKQKANKPLTDSDDDHVAKIKEWPYEVLKQFRLIFKAVQQHSQLVETHSGITSAQLWAMWELSRNPGLKVTELANAMSIHHSTACSLLDKLEKKGLVKRERVSRDQRVVTLTLTELGVGIIAQAPLPPKGILQNALFELPETNLRSLSKELDKLIQVMDIKNEEAAMQPINPLIKKGRTKSNK